MQHSTTLHLSNKSLCQKKKKKEKLHFTFTTVASPIKWDDKTIEAAEDKKTTWTTGNFQTDGTRLQLFRLQVRSLLSTLCSLRILFLNLRCHQVFWYFWHKPMSITDHVFVWQHKLWGRHQDGRVVKALDLSSNGQKPSWVRTPLLVDLWKYL